MRRVVNFIMNIFKNDSIKPLGRWNLENCSKKINRKIDLSNEDHCGPCGQNANTNISRLKNKNIEIK